MATDATRLVARFNKDWITQGRRPAGICGACLLLAARMNHFRRSIAEIVQVVKIADITLRKRLDDFKQTPSGKLTIDDFRNIWLEQENEPPAYYLARMPKQDAKKGKEGIHERNTGKRKMREEQRVRVDQSRKRRKQLVNDSRQAKFKEAPSDAEEERQADSDNEAREYEDDHESDGTPADENSRLRGLKMKESDEALILDPRLEALADKAAEEEISRALQEEAARRLDADLTEDERSRMERAKAGTVADHSRLRLGQVDEGQKLTRDHSEIECSPTSSRKQTAEATSDLPRSSRVTQPIKKPISSLANAERDDLLGLDEAELDAFILTEEEAKIKERVWIEFNRDYLEKSLEKQLKLEADMKMGILPKSGSRRSGSSVKRSTSARPASAGTGSRGSAAAENAKMMMSRKRNFSRKLNYDVINSLFEDDDEKRGKSSAANDRKRKKKPGGDTENESENGRAYTDGENEVETEGEGELTEAESIPDWKKQMNKMMGRVDEDDEPYDDYEEEY